MCTKTEKSSCAVGLATLLVAITSAPPVRAAGLLIADGGFGGMLEITEHVVNVTINNGVAVTEVNQVFRNTENRQVEALYTFPVSKGASVANFSMWINGKEMIGEVVEKKRARQIYDSYKQKRRDPGLLEQTDYKTFEMRIFPIAAQAEQRVQIAYYQELDTDHDWSTYVYPLATATRSDIDSKTRGKFSLTLHAKSEVPIVATESPSHGEDFVFVRHNEAYFQGSLEAEGGNLDRDVVLAYQVSRPRTGVDIITSKQKGDDGYFMLTLTAGEELAGSNGGADYVFILDISGSMTTDGKLRISRESIAAFIDTLGEGDRFEIITFNISAHPMFGDLQDVSDQTKDRAREFLATQNARGGTTLRPALETAYKYGESDRTMNIVILSDGMTEQGERDTLIQMIGSRPRYARVFCIGVGNEVNRPLLSQMAEDAGGLAAFLSPGDSFERQASAFRRKLTRPVATDLRIQLENADAYDLEPERLPNLYHGSPVRLYGRYRKTGPTKVRVQAEVVGTVIDQKIDITLPAVDENNPEIERMWAWHKMDGLLKQADRAGGRSQVVDEIVRLGEGYAITSEYTSFLVLENDEEYKRWKIERRNALRMKRDRRSHEQLLAQLERMRSEAMASLGPSGAERMAAATTAPPQTPDLNQQLTRADGPTRSAPTPQRTPRRFDIDFSPRGGGVIDPVTACVGLGLAGLAVGTRRRKDNHRGAER